MEGDRQVIHNRYIRPMKTAKILRLITCYAINITNVLDDKQKRKVLTYLRKSTVILQTQRIDKAFTSLALQNIKKLFCFYILLLNVLSTSFSVAAPFALDRSLLVTNML